MEPKILNKSQDKAKELKTENRRLKRELKDIQNRYEILKQDFDRVMKHSIFLEEITAKLISTRYGDKVKVDFNRYEICIDQKCVGFPDYSELLMALKILPILL
ncbi:hypothetical protein HAV1_gp05 [Hyperthermophilic Archaeal Virus 1]|uniref:hypothetical protein n=1 Tax=Hyperthermophilic Archaeal Virus 1 TaxID=762905 RepID=UPI0001DBADF0|nr:hypothetical protein HAV1_gp05 [Hyperthermophilic Archaeal Virus 1]ADJ54228.1 hypothetical protein HAV1_gp05 [Hyperthermophilic Archaeal Virus 1]